MTTASSRQFVPEWAKGIIWYQIFPERFCNGDPGNDPTRDSLRGAWPFDHTSPWQVSPWTADWYRRQPWEQEGDIWSHLQRRRYGGDLQGILDRLDYLQQLGVGALYLNPVFASPSAHKYDGDTYHHIDPHFGPDPEGDRRLMAQEIPHQPETWCWTSADRLMLELIREVHRRGMRIIFDGVFNHVGWHHWAFLDVRERQQQSAYRDWFSIHAWDDPQCDSQFTYANWFGHENLPEWRCDESGLAEGPKSYVFAAARRWMDPDGDGNPQDGIDGWRMDVAFCLPHPFWREFRRHARAINPEAYLVAEVIRPPEEQKPYLRGDEFDAVMNYNFAFACSEFFFSQKHRITASEFDRRLRELRDAYPREVADVMQNLFGSHDSARLASQIVNRRSRVAYRSWLDAHHRSQVAHNHWYNTRAPRAQERQLQKLAVIFQMTYVGAPMIYYGDEAGMWGANDPCCRKPMVWPEGQYEPESYSPEGRVAENPDPVQFDQDLFQHHCELARIRNGSRALRKGDYRTLLTDDERGLYVFARRHGDEQVIVAMNNGRQPQTVQLPPGGDYRDLFHRGRAGESLEANGCCTVPPRWARILQWMP
jgi:glycosidase